MDFKHEKDVKLFTTLAAPLIMIFADLYWYAKTKHGISLVVTSTVSTLEEDIALRRTSSGHRDFRALDFRTKDLDAFIIEDLVKYINNKPEYKKYHYMSNSGISRLAYLHGSGQNEHVHLCLHRKYSNNLALISE